MRSFNRSNEELSENLQVSVEEGLEHVVGRDGLVSWDHVAGALDGYPRKSVELLVPAANLLGFVFGNVGPLAVFFFKLKSRFEQLDRR